MSNILRDAAETTISAAESTLQSVADFVEDAYRHIDLPLIDLPKRRRSRRVTPIALAIVASLAVAAAVATVVRRSAQRAAEPKGDDRAAAVDGDVVHHESDDPEAAPARL